MMADDELTAVIEVPAPPVLQAQVQTSDGLILAVGWFPGGSSDPATIEVVDLDAEQAAAVAQPGTKYLESDGTIRVEPVSAQSKYAALREQRLAAELAGAAERLAQTNTEYAVILKASGGIV